MKLIYPDFLIALIVLLIPILIHFFQFKRYKTVYFSQVGFLKAVQQETKKKSELKKRLILLSRLIALAALVIAFAQPYIPVNQQKVTKARQLVSIYLDNSYSMMNQSEEGQLLEAAKVRLIDIANNYQPDTRFLLLTNEANPGQLLPIGRELLLDRLSKIKESPKSLKCSEACRLLKNSMRRVDDKAEQSLYLLSDFQAQQTDIKQLKEDSLVNTFLINFQPSVVNNLVIDSCWFNTPSRRASQTEKLFIKLTNQSEQLVHNQNIRLLINDSLKAISNLNMEANESQVLEMNYRNNKAGFHEGIVELDDFPITYDNRLYFGYEVSTKIKSLLIHNDDNESIKHVETLFANDPLFSFEKVEASKFQPNQIDQEDFVILLNLKEFSSGLSKKLVDFTKKGGTVCILPGNDIDLASYNSFYEKINANTIVAKDSSLLRIKNIEEEHPLFNDVFEQLDDQLQLPEIHSSYRHASRSTSTMQKLVGLNNGNSAINAYSVEKGNFFQFCFPMVNNESFFIDALYVSLLYNMALNSQEPQDIFFNINSQMYEEVKKEQHDIAPFEIRKPGSNEQYRVPVLNESLNHARLDFSYLIDAPGFYELTSKNKLVRKLTFNQNRNESLRNSLSNKEIEDLLKESNLSNFKLIDSKSPDFTSQIKEINEGLELWYFFILLAAAFLFIETAIIRWMK